MLHGKLVQSIWEVNYAAPLPYSDFQESEIRTGACPSTGVSRGQGMGQL